jgi:site-specific DNA-methyltransferase (cytosine-N4-specific)
MKQLLKNGYRAKLRPSGHDISTKFNRNNNGAIPPNLIELANTESNSSYLRLCKEHGVKPHPARFPAGFPEFFINFTTDPNDLVLDPFAGSNTTGWVAERMNRRLIAFDLRQDYLAVSRFRFEEPCSLFPLSSGRSGAKTQEA